MAWFNFSYQGNDTYKHDTAVIQGSIGFGVNVLMITAMYGRKHYRGLCTVWTGSVRTAWVTGEGVANGDQLFLGRGGRVDPIEAG